MDYNTVLTGVSQSDAILGVFTIGIITIGTIGTLIGFAVSILMIVSQWKVFEKAGQPGWGILIPIYNIYLMFKTAGRPGGWTRWLLFPPVFLILMIILNFDIAKRFKKPPLFGVGLWILPIVFYPILAFDKKAKWTPKK